MDLKNIFLILSICFISVTAAANSVPNTENFYARSIYVDVNTGYASINWKDFSPTRNFNFTNNASGGFTIGADTGYQYNRYFAFELGWYYLPQAGFNTLNNIHFKVQSWLAYFGFSLSAPLSQHFSFFVKLALAYRNLEFQSSPVSVPPDGRHNLWRPLAAVGWRCYFGPNWSILMQYMYLPGRNSSSSAPGAAVSPVANVITLGYSYRFEI